MKTKYYILGLLVIITLADIITALMVMYKQPHFNESNPLYLLTGSFGLLIVYKLIMALIIILYFKYYHYKLNIYARYMMSIFLFLMIVGQGSGAFSNSLVYLQPPEEVQPIPPEVRSEYYNEKYIAPFVWLILLMFVPFIIFQKFENI